MDQSIETKTCAVSGTVSYVRKETCAHSGKVSYSNVNYDAASNSFVNASPAAMESGKETAKTGCGSAHATSASGKACCASGASASGKSCCASKGKAASVNTDKVKEGKAIKISERINN
jgi:hypothetical protein